MQKKKFTRKYFNILAVILFVIIVSIIFIGTYGSNEIKNISYNHENKPYNVDAATKNPCFYVEDTTVIGVNWSCGTDIEIPVLINGTIITTSDLYIPSFKGSVISSSNMCVNKVYNCSDLSGGNINSIGIKYECRIEGLRESEYKSGEKLCLNSTSTTKVQFDFINGKITIKRIKK